jgi:site-specific recombinase XerD
VKPASPRTKEREITLRHTFGTTLAKEGRPMRQIQMLMGHSTLTVTEKW